LAELNTGNSNRFTGEVPGVRAHICDMNGLTGACGSGGGEAWTGTKYDARLQPVAKCGWDVVSRRHPEFAILAKPQNAEFRAADAGGILKDGLKDRLKVTRSA
jgi:hypothetical protein